MTEDTTSFRGIEMDDPAIQDLLYEIGHGVLSLGTADDVYGVPISFGYDGETIYMYLIRFGEDSTKLDFSDESNRACLTAYSVATRFDWRSVIVTGTLESVPDDQVNHMDETMQDNAWSPVIYPPSEPMTGIERMALQIESVTGRQGEVHQ